MRILVTGARGFLGPYLIKALSQINQDGSKLEIIGLARKPQELDQREALPCMWHVGDITDLESLRGAFQNVDVVFHLASRVSLYSSDRAELEKTNVEGTRNVVDLCRENKVKRLIHVSSVAAIGASFAPTEPLNEKSSNCLQCFQLPNFDTKLKGEEIVLEASRRNEIDAVVVNPSMIFGAGDAKKAPRKGNLLAARGELSFYTGGGISVVAVEDVVEGLIAAWRVGRNGERYILSGENLSLREVLKMYAEATGKAPPKFQIPSSVLRSAGKMVDRLKWEIPFGTESAMAATLFHWYDHSKARKELGFRPRPAREAIQSSVQWMEENGYLK